MLDCLRWVAQLAAQLKGPYPRGLRLKQALQALKTANYEVDLEGGPERLREALEWVAKEATAVKMLGLAPDGSRLPVALSMLKQYYAALPKQ